MSKTKKSLIALIVIILVLAGVVAWLVRGNTADLPMADVMGTDPVLLQPEEEMIPTVKLAKPVGWRAGQMPTASQGLAVTRFADGLDHPRTMHVLPNGDVLVSLTRSPPIDDGGFMGWAKRWVLARVGSYGPSPNTLMLLHDSDGDGAADQKIVLTAKLDSPSGIAWRDGKLYVANYDEVLEFPYELGATRLVGEGRKLLDLPSGGDHWMRNLELDEAGAKLYIAIGSSSNIGENGMEAEEGRAMIWEYDIASGSARSFASGLRNPNGLDWNPWSGELWATVNERDMMGSDLVPDYLTSVPIGAQYGWPWIYYKDNFDRRVDAPMPAYLQEYVRWPEYALGPHVAALGLAFSKGGTRLGSDFSHGAIIARHGSWNRRPASGYDVIYVPFDERGNPKGAAKIVIGGFLNPDGTTKGRPTWVAWAGDGALLVSDDTGGIIWRVVDPKAEPSAAIAPNQGRSLPPQNELHGEAKASFGKDDYARIVPAQ